MGDFLDLGFDNALTFDFQMPAIEQFDAGDWSAYQGYEPPAFDFQPSSFELQGPVWDANSWLQQTTPPLSFGGDRRLEPAGVPQISHYDPSTGVYFDSAGNPVQPQSGGPVGGPMTPGGEIAQDPEALARRGAYSQVAPNPYAPGPAAGVASSPAPGWMDTVNRFLGTNLGGLLGAAGVGTAGLGVGRLLAGPPPKMPTPQLAPGSPTNAAGQQTMADFYNQQAQRELGYQAEQAPGYQGIRQQAMTLIPGQLNPVTVDNYQDPVQQALQAELMATLQGGASPLVEEQIRKDWATLQNQMYRQLGNNADWATSSPGQEAIQAFNRNAAIARDQSKMGRIAALAPLEGQRQQWTYQAPVEKARALGGEQRAYVDTLSRTSALGRMDPASIQAGLGGQPDQYRAMMTTLGSQGQMAGYGTANQERRDTMAGVGGIAGTVAGQLGNAGQAERIARAIREQNGGTTPAWGSGLGWGKGY